MTKQKQSATKHPDHEHLVENPNHIEPSEFKPKMEGINNTDVPGVPPEKRAKNNPTHQNEGLSGGGSDPLDIDAF